MLPLKLEFRKLENPSYCFKNIEFQSKSDAKSKIHDKYVHPNKLPVTAFNNNTIGRLKIEVSLRQNISIVSFGAKLFLKSVK